MATQQDEGGVPLSIAHDMQQFRLFELPPEIVELVDTPSPPLLSIKSQAPSNAPGAKPAYAVLCTPNKSYHLRQVQTSNSLFITKPTLETQGNEIPIPVTRAIASCTATLELNLSDASAATLLQEILPVFDIVAGEADATGNGKDKATIFDDIPLSETQCQAGWNEVLAFMHDGSSYRPSPVALSCIWKSISAFALAEGIRLDKQFLTSDVSRAVAEEGYPEGLAEAVLRYLCTDDEDATGPWSCLDGTKTIAFTGRTLLETRTGNDYLIAEFTDAWMDQLPEIWRQDAKLAAIEGIADFPTDTTVRAKSKGPASSTNSGVSGPSAKPSARKWHEKFGKTRNK